MILRVWKSKIRTHDRTAYRDYIAGTGLTDYRNTPGNCGCQMLMRDLPDQTTEVMTMSWWDDLESIKKFAGEAFLSARYYPEDDKYLLSMPEAVKHFDIVAGTAVAEPAERTLGS